MNDIACVVNRFANSMDLKDWNELKSVLCEHIDVDYTDLRGTRETQSRHQFVALRETALQDLDTHHILANHDIQLAGERALCICSAMIFRKRDQEEFNSHVVYRFGLSRSLDCWRISSIQQSVLWNEGNPNIHAGAKPTSK